MQSRLFSHCYSRSPSPSSPLLFTFTPISIPHHLCYSLLLLHFIHLFVCCWPRRRDVSTNASHLRSHVLHHQPPWAIPPEPAPSPKEWPVLLMYKRSVVIVEKRCMSQSHRILTSPAQITTTGAVSIWWLAVILTSESPVRAMHFWGWDPPLWFQAVKVKRDYINFLCCKFHN